MCASGAVKRPDVSGFDAVKGADPEDTVVSGAVKRPDAPVLVSDLQFADDDDDPGDNA